MEAEVQLSAYKLFFNVTLSMQTFQFTILKIHDFYILLYVFMTVIFNVNHI